MAFLGKISAVISANTQDFTRNIGTAKRELQSFAQQTRGMQMNLDDRALNKTLTGLQRFQRQLQEIRRMRAAGIDAGLPNPETLNDLYRAFEDIGKPLTALKTKIEGFSNSVQAGLYGELGRVQSGFQNLYKQIQNGAATFDGQTAKIERLQAALRNLSIAAAGVGELDSLSKNLAAENLGASFFQPYALDEMKRTKALRTKAMDLPAQYRTGDFADRFMQSEVIANQIAEQSSRVAAVNAAIARNGGDSNPRNAGRVQARARYQAQLDSLTQSLAGVNDDTARGLRNQALAQIASPSTANQADRLSARLGDVAEKLRKIDAVGFEKLIGGAAAAAQAFEKDAASAERAKRKVKDLENTLESFEGARKQQSLFLAASGGSSEKLSQGARDAAADISVARQFRGQIPEGGSRIAADTAIERTTRRITLLQEQMARVAASNLIPSEKAKQLDVLDNKIRTSTKNLANFISLLSNGKFSQQRIEASMARARNQAGSLSTGGSMAFQLALQQGLFAIDDFMSATGGLEYKLRAVGNNITQLGLLLGTSGMIPGLTATTGLLVGLGAVMAAQVVPIIARFAFELGDADAAQKKAEATAKAMTGALQRQADAARDLADAYRQLGRSAIERTETKSQKEVRERKEKIDDLKAKQAEALRAAAQKSDPQSIAALAEIADIKDRMEREQNPGMRAGFQRRADDLGRLLDGRAEVLLRRAGNMGVLGRTDRELQDIRRGKIGEVRRLEDLNILPGQRGALMEDVAAIEVLLQQRRNERGLQAAGGAAGLVDVAAAMRDRISGRLGVESFAEKQIAASGADLAELIDRGSKNKVGKKEAEAIIAENKNVLDSWQEFMKPLERLGDTIDEASKAAEQFESETGMVAKALSGAIEASRQRVQAPMTLDEIEQQRVALTNQARAARKQLERRREQEQERDRGAELALSDREKTRRQMQKDVEALALANPDIPGIIDPDKRNQALQAGFRNVAEQAAPAMVSMFEQVQNAILQGPSRAALQASDITTSEGSRELGRLLRGDDAARNNQNLVELQKANENLRNLQQVIKDALGITLEL